MKRCPKCRSLMPEDVHLCIRCGFDSKPAASSLIAPSNAPKLGRLRGGWLLMRESCKVLMLDKELLLFPLLSGIASLFVLASFVGGVWASGLAEQEASLGETTAWLILFAYYFANYFVIVAFNSALVGCAMIRFRGGDPTFADGLRVARERMPQIVAWALLAATIGTLLRIIEERVGFVGKIVTAVLGAAWTIATYFVVPVLVVEKLGPVDAAKRSAAVVKKAWGESIVSNAGIGLVVSLLTMGATIVVAVGFGVLALKTGSFVVAIIGALAVIGVIVLGTLIGSALSSIVLSALYLYATEGKVPQAFANAGLQHAFAPKG
ncbi:MAG TPA: DUF6159 family protein [Burkholderiales bacterium]|nr:DUF6159 family protein [Burkholderiales bacterium]